MPTPRAFDFRPVIDFLGPRAVPSLEEVSTTAYRRSLRLDGRPITVDVERRDATRLTLRSAPTLSREEGQAIVREQFDLEGRFGEFRRRVARDVVLGPFVKKTRDLRIVRYLDPFEGTIRAILGQQVSVAAARTMTDRLVRLDPDPAPRLDGRELLLFPAPERVASMGRGALRGIGLTNAKADALVAVSEAVLSRVLDWSWLMSADPDAAQARLESVRGIGPWTATYVRMRVLADRDAFPATDLGVVKAFQAAARTHERPTTRDIVARAERWRPWRAYATLLLWRSLAGADVETPVTKDRRRRM